MLGYSSPGVGRCLLQPVVPGRTPVHARCRSSRRSEATHDLGLLPADALTLRATLSSTSRANPRSARATGAPSSVARSNSAAPTWSVLLTRKAMAARSKAGLAADELK